MRGSRLRRRWLPVLAAFLVGGASVGVAQGHGGFPDLLHSGHNDTMRGSLKVTQRVRAGDFIYLAPKANRLVVPAGAFRPCTDGTSFGGSTSGFVSIGASGCMVAPVSLPQGAVLTMVVGRHWFSDGTFRLEFADQFTQGNVMATIQVTGCTAAPCVTSTTDINHTTIDNRIRNYGVRANDVNANGFGFNGVEVHYKTNRPGPATG